MRTKTMSMAVAEASPAGFTRLQEDSTIVVASAPVEDRDGDILQPPWKLDNYATNPVILVFHDYRMLPVARAIQVAVVGDRLVAELVWDDEDPFAKQVRGKVDRGFLNTVSVGFIAATWRRRSELPEGDALRSVRGFLVSDIELLEISFVPVPANQVALVQRGLEAMVGDLESLLRAHPEQRGLVIGRLLDGQAASTPAAAPEDLSAFFAPTPAAEDLNGFFREEPA